MRYDENGWAAEPIAPLPMDRAYSLFAAEPSARVDIARWAHQARRFFDASLEVTPAKKYPDQRAPDRDEMTIEIVAAKTAIERVRVVTVPLIDAPGAFTVAMRACEAIGGAGMDAVVARAVRLWQVEDAPSSPAALRVASVLAAILLAPIVPPDARAIFGVKGARERLAKTT